MRTTPPLLSIRSVETIAVLRTYSERVSTCRSSTTSVKPLSSFPASNRKKTGTPSERGKHHHTMREEGSSSAAVRPLPMTARSSPWSAIDGYSPIGKNSQGVTDLRRIFEYSRQPRKVTIDTETLATNFGQNLEYRLIGHVISDKHRHSSGEGRVLHQPANTLAFIDAWTLDLEHRLAEQQFGRLPRKRRPDGRNMPAQAFGQFGRFPVVQRQGITLVLYNNAGAGTRAFCKAPAQLLRQWLGPEKDLVVAQAHLSAMAPDSRQAQGCKEAIQIANWTTAHQSKRPVC